VDLMQADGDPRLPVYAQPIPGSVTRYAGMPNGLRQDSAGRYFNTASRLGAVFYPGATAYGTFGGDGARQPSYLMTYAEVALAEAEAAERGLGGLARGQAEGFYRAGVAASLAQWGITDAAAVDIFLARPGVSYRGGVEGLKQIAVQKWIALYTDGGQAWAEWRRTCQPSTIAPGPAAGVDYVPRRFLYPVTEASVNGASLAAAVARQGPDVFATRVWWDTRPQAAPTCG
jgi:hypothetical protein